MGVRVWGVVDDRLVELVTGPSDRFEIVGLPPRSARATTDRVRAALINTGLIAEVPAVVVALHPAIEGGTTSDLDVAVAMAALAGAGALDGNGIGWVLAVGRLGLDGTIHAYGLERTVKLADAVAAVSVP